MIEQILWPIDHDELRQFPTNDLTGRDLIIWHYNSNGVYSVKSGYHLVMDDGMGNSAGIVGGNTRDFRKLWHLNIQNKIKKFFLEGFMQYYPPV